MGVVLIAAIIGKCVNSLFPKFTNFTFFLSQSKISSKPVFVCNCFIKSDPSKISYGQNSSFATKIWVFIFNWDISIVISIFPIMKNSSPFATRARVLGKRSNFIFPIFKAVEYLQ
ncbi:unnamed protein product [Meloidogyne enterolobii]|uniref:Uncharacterized protein n=1 Tax=Meloidogyne enterolobii TaxID=390850 RepID=A0ACB0YQ59_MELEN